MNDIEKNIRRVQLKLNEIDKKLEEKMEVIEKINAHQMMNTKKESRIKILFKFVALFFFQRVVLGAIITLVILVFGIKISPEVLEGLKFFLEMLFFM